MTIDERARHEMYLGLEEKLGPAVADAVMQHLPPVGWADVATRPDLEQLEARVGSRIDQLEHRLGDLELRLGDRIDHVELRLGEHVDARLHAEINRLLLFLFPAMLTAIGLAAVIARSA